MKKRMEQIQLLDVAGKNQAENAYFAPIHFRLLLKV